MKLLNKGEERLLQAVEKHQIPLSVAVTIASSNDKSVQRAMADAYEKKELRGRALLKARRLIEATPNPRQEPFAAGFAAVRMGKYPPETS